MPLHSYARRYRYSSGSGHDATLPIPIVVGTTREKSIAPASTFRALWLVPMALACILVSGCGGTTATPGGPPEAPAGSLANASVAAGSLAASGETASGETDSVTQAGQPRSLHERAMAEQRQREAAAATERQTTTTSSTAALEPAATAAVDPAVDPNGATAAVLTDGQTPLKGLWSGTVDRLSSYLEGICPSPSFTVPVSVLAEYYVYYCAQAGLRADLLWAQMIHETGYGVYGGDVLPEQNNYAGIGATGGGEPGTTFPTAEAGVIAHVAHVVAYVYDSSPVAWADATTDPRFDFVNPRGVAVVLADLNGRWAVPGTTYGQSIEEIARAINVH